MQVMDVKWWVLRTELFVHRINPLLLLGLVFWVGAVLMHVYFLPAWKSQLQVVQAEFAQVQALFLQRMHEQPGVQTNSDQENMERFTNILGDAKHVEQELKTLFVIARDLELSLTQGQYKLNCESGSEFCQYRMQLPMNGSYARVRLFMEQTLKAIPFASIDEITFKRESISDSDVSARIKITLLTLKPAALQSDAQATHSVGGQ